MFVCPVYVTLGAVRLILQVLRSVFFIRDLMILCRYNTPERLIVPTYKDASMSNVRQIETLTSYEKKFGKSAITRDMEK